MATFLFAFIFFLLVVAGMAIGVILRNKPIKGSCGGLGALGLDTSCDICGGDPGLCEKESRKESLKERRKESRGANGSRPELYYPADRK